MEMLDQAVKMMSGAEETEIEHYEKELAVARARLEAATGELHA